MSAATTFRAALGAAAIFLIVGLAAIANHFIQGHHPAFGLRVGGVLVLIGLALAIYANYNRPTSRL